MPTAPSPSPTTVSAAKPRIRPPFTTLVTRFTETIFSFRPSERCSPPCILGCILAIVIPLECSPKSGPREEGLPFAAKLELEAGLSRGVCQRFDPAVVLVAGAVERNGLDAQTFRFLGDTLAYRDRCRLVAAVRERSAHALPLVGFGRAVGAHLGGDLSHELLVEPLDHDFGLRGSLDLHPFGHGVHHGMRKAQG